MKKFIIAMAVLLMLTACEKEQLIDETEATKQTDFMTVQSEETTTAAISAVEPSETTIVGLGESRETTAETSAVTEEVFNEGEEVLLRFLKCLQTGEGEPFEYGDPLDVYDFMDDFTLDDYSYTYKGDGIYGVTLNCSDSTADMFPNGVSEWVFNSTYLTCFIPAEREENRNTTLSFSDPDYDGKDSLLYSAYEAAVDFSSFTGAYEADGEWFENFDISNGEYSTEQYVHWIYHAYNPYIAGHDSESHEYYDVTPEEFAAAVKKLYNINMTAEQAQSMTDETGFMRRNCGHGGSWLYRDLTGYEETDSEIKVTVDYYGDSIFFYPTLQSEYTFSKNEDGTITLQKVEKLFDKGYDIASFST